MDGKFKPSIKPGASSIKHSRTAGRKWDETPPGSQRPAPGDARGRFQACRTERWQIRRLLFKPQPGTGGSEETFKPERLPRGVPRISCSGMEPGRDHPRRRLPIKLQLHCVACAGTWHQAPPTHATFIERGLAHTGLNRNPKRA